MIDTLFWYTGLAVWMWISFIALLGSLVALENHMIIKRIRRAAPECD